jgi:hypothetical protein
MHFTQSLKKRARVDGFNEKLEAVTIGLGALEEICRGRLA